MRAPILPIVFAVLLLGFAPAPFPKRARPQTAREALKDLQGGWVIVRRSLGGRDLTPAGNGMTAEVAGNRVCYYLERGARTEWAITLDITKVPRIFDQKRVDRHGGECLLWGVYRLEGDTLTICYHSGQDPRVRPRSLEGTRPAEWLEVFKRRKR
jgi:uncharacterized protein (TIGR03067 family)